jgi:hypothetical protein
MLTGTCPSESSPSFKMQVATAVNAKQFWQTNAMQPLQQFFRFNFFASCKRVFLLKKSPSFHNYKSQEGAKNRIEHFVHFDML